MSFNIIARALRFLMNVGILVPATHFFDDYSHVEPKAFAAANSEAVEWILTPARLGVQI